MDRKEYAVEKFKKDCNCCQAVLCAFTDEAGEEEMKKLGAAFGLGMGNMEGTCGALVAAEMLLGLKKYDGRPMVKQAKAVSEMFRLLTGSTICKEIKGRDTGKVLCSCDDCVRNAVSICESKFYEK
ncbi:MAG: C_GCAxxG_C_C family protein [Eubacterium sp.]|nr:C_GCAxxG_C_C family protein [Eubacterium sp.]